MAGVREELAAGIAVEATSNLPSLNCKTARCAQHAGGNLDNRMSGLFARIQRASMSAYFTNR